MESILEYSYNISMNCMDYTGGRMKTRNRQLSMNKYMLMCCYSGMCMTIASSCMR